MSLVSIRLFSSAVLPTPADPRDRFRFGVGVDVLLGIGLGVRLEPDIEPDPHNHPTEQVDSLTNVNPSATTEPVLGFSQWGKEPYRQRL
jgi:hypothetical protein